MARANDSFTATVKALKEGESASRAERFPLEDLDVRHLKKRLSGLRNSMNQIASRAKEDGDRSFTVESNQFVSYDGSAVIICVVITCIDEDAEDDI